MTSPASAPTIEYLDAKDQIAMLQEENKQLWATVDIMQRDLQWLSKRIKALEGRKEDTPAAKNHLDTLYKALLSSGQAGMTYPQLAAILKVSGRRAKQLRGAIEEDGRFMIIRHPTRTNAHVICLKKVRK
jgi:septal ring factor EnvC (AmiA/AmiB activator)